MTNTVSPPGISSAPQQKARQPFSYRPVGEICNLLGLPVEAVLAGRHVPCPHCNVKKFRISKPGKGSSGCDACGATHGDYTALWLAVRNCDWRTACRATRVASGNLSEVIPNAAKQLSRARQQATPFATESTCSPRQRLIDAKPADDMSLNLMAYTNKKKDILPAFRAFGAMVGKFQASENAKPQTVIAIPAWDAETLTRVVNYQIYGVHYPIRVREKNDAGEWVTVEHGKYTAERGTPDGVIVAEEDRLSIVAGEPIDDLSVIRCEGPSDCMAAYLLSRADEDRVIPFTNLYGCRSMHTAPALLPLLAKLKPVLCLTCHDCDVAGQESAVRGFPGVGWANLLREVSSDSRNVVLPYAIAEKKGKDLRDWIADGGNWDAFGDLGAVSDRIDGRAEPIATHGMVAGGRSEPDETNVHGQAVVAKGVPETEDIELPPVDIANYDIEIRADDKGEEKPVKVPRSIAEIIKSVQHFHSGFPKVCAGQLFVESGGNVHFLRNSSALFAFLRYHDSGVRWTSGDVFSTKEELHAGLLVHAERFAEIQRYPHFPNPIDDVHYTCVTPEKGNGEYLERFLDFFSPDSPLDRELILAAAVTPAWSGPPGQRPAFLIASRFGQGAGKSSAANAIARAYGGCFEFNAKGDFDKERTRLLSGDSFGKRCVLMDNLKSQVFASANFEATITAPHISGHRMYIGEASRPNYFTFFLTMNAPSLGRDVAQRAITIMLGQANRRGSWVSEVDSFFRDHHWDLLADIRAFFDRPVTPISSYSRWGAWQSEVLCRLDNPQAVADLLAIRESENDADGTIARGLEAWLLEFLTARGYAGRYALHLPNHLLQRAMREVDEEELSPKRATQTLNRYAASGMFKHLSPNPSRKTTRGWVWRSEEAETLPIAYSDKFESGVCYGDYRTGETKA